MKQLLFTCVAFILCCNSIYADDKEHLYKSVPLDGDTILWYGFTNHTYVNSQKECNNSLRISDLYFPRNKSAYSWRIHCVYSDFWRDVKDVHKWQLYNMLNAKEIEAFENMPEEENTYYCIDARLEVDYKQGKIYVPHISFPNVIATLFTSQRIHDLILDIKKYFYLPPLSNFHEGMEHLFSNVQLKKKDIEYFKTLIPDEKFLRKNVN